MDGAWKPGQCIRGEFEIEAVALGGMALVYTCFSKVAKQRIILKTFHDKFIADNKIAHQFIKEATNWISLDSHKNIVQAFAVLHIHFRPFILLEYIACDPFNRLDLSDYIISGSGLPLKTLLNMGLQFCDGMIHARKKIKALGGFFVHGDIKPSNILITDNGTLKISDFGLSSCVSEAEGHRWGTPAYMSPEHFTLNPLDVRSDIYSFGCVLYEMAKGAKPFEIEDVRHPNAYKLYREKHFQHLPRAPMPCNSESSSALNRLILGCLEKDPSKRIADFSVLRNELLLVNSAISTPITVSESDERKMSRDHMINKAVSLVKLGKYRQAAGLVDNINAKDRDPKTEWAKHLINGTALASMQKRQDALIEFSQAIRLFPDHPLSYIDRANLFNNEGDFEQALKDYNKAIACDNSFVDAIYNRGLCFFRMEQFDKAYMDFSRAIELGHHESYTNRGAALLQLGQLEEALSDFNRALGYYLRNPLALMNIGIIYEERGDGEMAKTYYTKAIDCSPHYPLPYLKRAGLLVREKNFQEAIRDYETAIEVNQADSALDIGVDYSMSKSERDRVNGLLLHDCGICCLEMGRFGRGKEYLQRFLDTAPPCLEHLFNPARKVLEWAGDRQI